MRYLENPPNPWLTHSVEWLGEPPAAKLEVFEETETQKGKQAQHTAVESVRRSPGRKRK